MWSPRARLQNAEPMPLRPQPQVSFFDPEFADPGCLEPGTLPWLLSRHRRLLFPAWLFVDWKRAGQTGPKGWAASVLMTLMLLRWFEEGMSRTAAVRRAKRDTTWRAAMGLRIGGKTPSLRTVRRFESFLKRRHPETGVPHYILLHEHFVRLCFEAGVVDGRAVWAMDSTPMWAYGAMQGTIRLLGDGLRTLCRRWAKLTARTVATLAAEWDLPLLVARSTKGAYRVDWRDADQRAGAMDRIAGDVLRVADLVTREVEAVRANKRKGIRRMCRNLLKVIRDDMETDGQGRLVIAKRTAKGRLVSITDPQARHGRKSRSRKYKGFKTHVLGDVVSGLLLSLAVTPGGTHDNVPAHRLIRRAKELCNGIDRVLGDTAYSAARLRHIVHGSPGVELLAPPQPVPINPARIERRDFDIDLAAGTATCPEGASVEMSWSWSGSAGMHVRRAAWPRETCAVCPRRKDCIPPSREHKGYARKLRLHPYEAELSAAREAWERPEVREDYRVRSQCERLVNQITRHGGRKARAWGLATANLQAHLIAMRCNLALLAQALARREEQKAAPAA